MPHNGLHRRELCIQHEPLKRLRDAAHLALTEADLAQALDRLRHALRGEMATAYTVGMVIYVRDCTYSTIEISTDQKQQVDHVRRQALDHVEVLLGRSLRHGPFHESVSTSEALVEPPDGGHFLHAPLVQGSEPIGLLFADAIQPEHAGHMILQVAAELFSPVITALDRTLTFRNTDPLTGLYNRRHMGESLQQHLTLGTRQNTSTCLVLIDLDHFKQLNDTLGHPAGDDVLVAFAGHLRSSIRCSDIACRYGGDEFALILPGTDSPQAERLMNRLRQTRTATLPDLGLPLGSGYSYGMAVAEPGTSMSVDTLIQVADKALYTAKRSA